MDIINIGAFALWRNVIIKAVMKANPLLTREQAWEVGRVAIKSWQDLRQAHEFEDHNTFEQLL